MTQGPTRSLLWSEEFADHNGGVLPENIWSFDIGDGSSAGLVGWGNNELEYYTKEAVTIDENLIIKAQRLDEQTDLNCYYGPAQWTSGKIHTARKVGFTYGHLEIRAKMPTGVGTWPALWLLGDKLLDGVTWPQCGEIDILENTGAHPFQIQGTIHGDGYSGENGLTKIIQYSEPLADAFHTYGISWNSESIEWFFDGISYSRILKIDPRLEGKPWPFDQEFYLIINLAIGGWFAGTVDPNLQSAQLIVDSIKYFSENGVGSLTLH